MRKCFLFAALAALALTLAFTLTNKPATAQEEEGRIEANAIITPTVFQAAGPTKESIQSNVDAFRNALGANNGNAIGPLPAGRREINWDGGGATTAALAATPFAGFRNARGALFTTPGSGFLQTPLNAPEFLAINPTYAGLFSTFSPQRVFTPIGSNITDIHFFVPGSTTPATVSGFGAIFSDVDLPNGTIRKRGANQPSTKMEFFDADGELLFKNVVPSSPGAGHLSFLGAILSGERIAWVRITSGNAALGPDEQKRLDLVVMDDFIYGEPQPEIE